MTNIFKKLFQRKEIASFFKSDSTVLIRLFYKTKIEDENITVPHKKLKFIRPIDAKRTEPKRMEFNSFDVLMERKTVFLNISLFGERRSGIYKNYTLELVELEGTWEIKYVKKIK